jgi:hypothetical protein
MIIVAINWFRWRPTPGRVRYKAQKLIRHNGELAFLRAHERAWNALGRDARSEALFWEAVAREVGRQIQRSAMLEHILAPVRPTAATTPPPIDPDEAPPPGAESRRRSKLILIHPPQGKAGDPPRSQAAPRRHTRSEPPPGRLYGRR